MDPCSKDKKIILFLPLELPLKFFNINPGVKPSKINKIDSQNFDWLLFQN